MKREPQVGADNATVALDPFTITESDNVGYSANSTLAGTRLNTPLRDVGASISIITPEFMSDIGATSAQQLLNYTVGTEVGGIDGNFSGDNGTGRPDQNAARSNPQDDQRVRGIGPASNTRDFFLTDIPFDTYNTARITINRGPNSLLFGIGNPAGIIEDTLIKAQLHRSQTDVNTRFGSDNSWRVALDHNQVLIKDRLALRLATVGQLEEYDQKPAYERNRRIFATLEGVIHQGQPGAAFGRTTMRGSAEIVNIRSNPVNVVPPTDAYSIFYHPLDPAIDNLPGVILSPKVKRGDPAYIWAPGVTVDNRVGQPQPAQLAPGYYNPAYFVHIPLIYDAPGQTQPGYLKGSNPALAGIAGIMGRIRTTPSVDMYATQSAYSGLTGFSTPTLQDRSVFDYRKTSLAGESSLVVKHYDAQNIGLTQELLNGDAGFELAYDKQSNKSATNLPFGSGSNGAFGLSDISIDVSQYLSNGQPNPDVGRPFVQLLGISEGSSERERESGRATAFYQLNLEKKGRSLFGIPLGDHTFTGFYSTQTIKDASSSYQSAWADNPNINLNTNVFQEPIAAGIYRRKPVVIQYLGPSVINANGTLNDLRITTPFTGHIPDGGESYRVSFYDTVQKKFITDNLSVARFLINYSRSERKIASNSFSVKSDFFAKNLVSVLGWRSDRVKTYSAVGNTRLADGSIDTTTVNIPSVADLDEKVHSFTWSVVGHYPHQLLGDLPLKSDISLYYNSSGNFNPTTIHTDLYNKIIAAPSGKTKEYGALFELLERRVSLRLNWFETSQANSTNDVGGATGAVYNWTDRMLNRYYAAESSNIPVSSIYGVSAAGFTTYDQIYAAFINLLPAAIKNYKNAHIDRTTGAVVSNTITGLSDTSDLNARGFEAELVGNLTPSWRISLNVGKQETILTNTARTTKAVADYVYGQLAASKLLGLDYGPALPFQSDISQAYNANVSSPLANTLARDGAVSQEQRKWRANLVTTYAFDRTGVRVLKNFDVGTGVRWQDKAAIGNYFLMGQRLKEKIVQTNPNYTSVSQISDSDPVLETQYPDLNRPIYAPALVAGDFWIGYRRKILGNIAWRLQLNVSNAWGNRDDVPIKANPDGSIAFIRIPNPVRWYLSSNFKF